MELLVGLIAQLLLALLAPICTIAFSILMAALEIVLSIICAIFSLFKISRPSWSPRKCRATAAAGATGDYKNLNSKSRWLVKRIAVLAVIFLAAIFASLAILQIFFNQSSVRWLTCKVAKKQGVNLTVKEAKGNLFTGRFQLLGLEVKGETMSGKKWNGQIEGLDVELDMFRLLSSRSILDRLEVAGGSFAIEAEDFGRENNSAGKYKEKRRFGIDLIQLEEIEVQWINDSNPERNIDFSIDEFELHNLKSEFAVFQIFFRSKAKGKVNQMPWSIETSGSRKGRETKWNFKDFGNGYRRCYVQRNRETGICGEGKISHQRFFQEESKRRLIFRNPIFGRPARRD